jgi:CheY-like chemotaxis protein
MSEVLAPIPSAAGPKPASAPLIDPNALLLQAQKLEVVGRLAGGVAHDFNNLLTVILGYSDLLLANLGKDDPVREGLIEIHRAADRATSLTRQLLTFSRRQVVTLHVLDLNLIVQALERMLRRLIGEDVELETRLASVLGRVRADAGQIEILIMNLAVNARDAMPHGGKILIETADVHFDQAYIDQHLAGTIGDYVMLAVSDTGIGMDETTKAHLFEPFFTTKEPGKGTGLGLATVYGIVKGLGGYVWVYSELGRGTTFKIYLPRIEHALTRPDLRQSRSDTVRGTETILLVEDEEAVRGLAQRVLVAQGYQVLTARDGTEALRLYPTLQQPVHLLVTDVVMPQMSGRQLVDALIQKGPAPRVLYCSGYTDSAIGLHGLLSPGAAFLEKPFTPDSLIRKVREVLDG